MDHNICRKQTPNPEVTNPDPLNTMAASRDPVHKVYEQNWLCLGSSGKVQTSLEMNLTQVVHQGCPHFSIKGSMVAGFCSDQAAAHQSAPCHTVIQQADSPY